MYLRNGKRFRKGSLVGGLQPFTLEDHGNKFSKFCEPPLCELNTVGDKYILESVARLEADRI